MWVLILLVCVNFINCKEIGVKGYYDTFRKCEAAVVKQWDEVKEGQALLCREIVGDINT